MSKEFVDILITGFYETLYMTVVSLVIAYVLGIPLGVLMYITDKKGISENSFVNGIFGAFINIVRSVPFFDFAGSNSTIYQAYSWYHHWVYCNHSSVSCGSSTVCS